MKNFLHHFFFPRESNNHRPRLLHHDSLLIIICLFLFATSLFAVVQNNFPKVLGISSNISVSELLTFTNQKRQEQGLSPLKLDNQLSAAAAAKAQHMFANNYWAHVAPDGTTPWYFVKQAGYEYLYAGENLARGFTTASAVIDAWMASPTHRENMLSSNYSDVGFAIETGTLTGSETILVVESLGSRYEPQTVAKVDVVSVSPTPVLAQVITPQPTVLPTSTPQPLPRVSEQPMSGGVAAVQNQPLFDRTSLTKQIALALLALFLFILVVDAIIIERKKIARVVGHNVDHIIFLVIIALIAIIIGRGMIQ